MQFPNWTFQKQEGYLSEKDPVLAKSVSHYSSMVSLLLQNEMITEMQNHSIFDSQNLFELEKVLHD